MPTLRLPLIPSVHTPKRWLPDDGGIPGLAAGQIVTLWPGSRGQPQNYCCVVAQGGRKHSPWWLSPVKQHSARYPADRSRRTGASACIPDSARSSESTRAPRETGSGPALRPQGGTSGRRYAEDRAAPEYASTAARRRCAVPASARRVSPDPWGSSGAQGIANVWMRNSSIRGDRFPASGQVACCQPSCAIRHSSDECRPVCTELAKTFGDRFGLYDRRSRYGGLDDAT